MTVPATTTNPTTAVVTHPNRWLDTVRGVAATAVVLFHLNEMLAYDHESYRAMVKLGWLGVPAFFVISGYLIVQSAQRSEWRGFAIRRWWRIYPPYVASLAVVVAVAVFRKLTLGINDVQPLPSGFTNWLATLTLTTTPVTDVPAINWVYWSLSCEVAFYVTLTAGLFFAAKRLPWVIAGITLACLIPGLPKFTDFFTENWWEFALGGVLALGVRRPESWLVIAASLGRVLQFDLATAGVLNLAVVAFTWLSIAWSRHRTGAWLNREVVFSRVGVVSYGLYLTHVPIGVYVFSKMRPAAVVHNLPLHVACDVLIYGLCLGFAWLFWKYIENPSHREGGRRAKRVVAGAAVS